MGFTFLDPERDQLYVMPLLDTDWLEEDHLVFFVLDAVDEMDLDPFYAKYRQDSWGSPAQDPKMMGALLVYAYCLGVRSSRQIERACHVDVALRVVAVKQTPVHTTIARFGEGHEAALKEVFWVPMRLCQRAGMAKAGLVALDGMKMAAPASMQKSPPLTRKSTSCSLRPQPKTPGSVMPEATSRRLPCEDDLTESVGSTPSRSSSAKSSKSSARRPRPTSANVGPKWFTLASLETPYLGFLPRWWCGLVQRRPARTGGLRSPRVP